MPETWTSYVRSLMTAFARSDPYLSMASNYPKAYSPINVYPHQIDLLSRVMYLRPIRILIGDEIGLGKTVESISIMRYLERAEELKRALIIVPRILSPQWVIELIRLGVPSQDIFIFESGKDIKNLKNIENQKYFIISIGLARMENHLKVLLEVNWDTILIDEAHNVTINSVKTKKATEKLVSDPSRNVIFLSATPHRGNAKDYLFRFRLLDPALIEDYSKMDIAPFYESSHDALLFRRTKEVVNNLQEEKVFKDCEFKLCLFKPTSDEKAFTTALLAFLKRKAKELGENGVNTPLGLLLVLLRKRASSSPYAAMKTLRAMISNLQKKQADTPIEYEDISEFEDILLGEDYSIDIETDFDDVAEKFVKRYSSALKPEDREDLATILECAGKVSKYDTKLSALKTMVLELIKRNEGKIIVFTEYRDTLEYISRSIEADKIYRDSNILFETISGQDSKERFDEVKRKFEDDPSVQLLIATDVASEGLNLQIANHLINYDAPWSPVKLEQRIGRIWRLGQKYTANVYNIFLATDADLAIIEKLYEKLLNIERAVGSTRPILGEEVLTAKLEASSGLWKTGEAGEVEYKGKKVKPTEHRIIYAELTDQLDEFISAFLSTIKSLNSELQSKNVFPIYTSKKIKTNLKRVINTDNLRDYEEHLEEISKRIGIFEGKSDYELKIMNHPVRLVEFLTAKLPKIPRLLFTTSDTESGTFHLMNMRINGRDQFFIYNIENGELLKGIDALHFISKISKNGLAATNSYKTATDIQKLKINQIGSIKNKFQISVEDTTSPFKGYFKQTEYFGLRNDGWKLDFQIKEPETISTVFITRRINEREIVIDEVLKEKIETAAMKISENYERDKSDVVEVDSSVHEKESYDILSTLKDGSHRYIEVKGHVGMKIYAELTPSELELAKTRGNDYYLHMVINLKINEYEEIDPSGAILLEFRDPLKTMRLKKIGGQERYILYVS